MKTSRFTDSQIIAILKQAEAEAEAGSPVAELCREHGVSNATFYTWRTKFGGMDASLMARMKELDDEKFHPAKSASANAYERRACPKPYNTLQKFFFQQRHPRLQSAP